MKKKYGIAVGFVLAAALVCYGFFQLDISQDERDEIAIAKAEARTAQFVNLAYKAYFTGDLSELKQYLAEKDSEGVVRGLLQERGIDLDAPRMRIMGMLSVVLPPFSDTEYFEDGSVLCSRTVGSTTSDLVHWIFPGIYTHNGLLDQDLYFEADDGCVITANLEGVTYETWNDWSNATTVTRLNLASGHKPASWKLNYAQRWIRWYMGWTIYSFLKLNLEPISRWDFLRWYCSKTVWRVYNKIGIDVENATWHGMDLDHEGVWTNEDKRDVMRTSGLYQIYKGFLIALGIDEDTATWLADCKLWRVLKEDITPDEIRFATTLFGGPLDPDARTWGLPE